MYILFAYLVVLLNACGPVPSPENTAIFSAIEPQTNKKENIWAKKSSWGSDFSAVDFSGKILFNDDYRIADIHKTKHSQLKNHVLWRVNHDGRCWLTSELILLFYEMTQNGKENYLNIMTNIRNITREYLKDSAEDLIAVFELLEDNLSLHFALDLMNHENTYNTLNRGMRKLLIASGTVKKSYENEYGWGMIDDFHPLFEKFGVKTYPWIADWANSIPSWDFNYQRKLILIQSTVFIDVLVEKTFSDKVNAGKL